MEKISRIILLVILLMVVLVACGPDKSNDIEEKELVEKLTEENLELKQSLDKKDNKFKNTLYGIEYKDNCSDFNTTVNNLIYDYENIKREYYE